MLTRLEIDGFKNLFGVAVDFGPYTCIAGPNAVGKSNLFDVIEFMSALASSSFVEAAQRIRSGGDASPDPELLFYRRADGSYAQMTIAAEMLLPSQVIDDFGQRVDAASTYVRYELVFSLRPESGPGGVTVNRMVLEREELVPLTRASAKARLQWLPKDSMSSRVQELVKGKARNPYIEMGDSEGTTVIKGFAKGSGRPRLVNTESTQRTVVSTANTGELPTVLAARREMEGWRKLALEPSAMRSPDDVAESAGVGANGAHLAIALARLMETDEEAESQVRAGAAALTNVREVRADVDQVRRVVTLTARVGEGPDLPARALSEGTLRFLALAIIQLDTSFGHLICMEEPENGIHPEKLPDMAQVLHDLAYDPEFPPDADNPLRQVIVNTHSPHFVAEHDDSEILVAVASSRRVDGGFAESLVFGAPAGTWRDGATRDRGDTHGDP
ncbi:AAA family ATPase [Brevibacterium album]|uniref:AAA family ATPase n=1 Tax=Brevibacterium album TaxID=417948 RepID=UPI0004198A6D|nr:AAA family ATPase [Brevibacterium album]